MNLQEAKAQLEKIITLYKSMTAQGTVSAIERDLMLAHIRKLYDIFLENTPPSVSPVAETPQVVELPKVAPQVVVEQPQVVELPKVVPQVVVEQPKVVELPKVVPQVVVEQPQVVELPKVAPQVVEVPKVAPQVVVEQPKVAEVPKVAPQMTTPTSEMHIIFEENTSQELSERLANTPIADLTKAFALNDRLLTQNELFGGNKTLFEEAVKLINGAANYDIAQAMMSDFASRYNWLANEDRKKVAKTFVKMVRRRFK